MWLITASTASDHIKRRLKTLVGTHNHHHHHVFIIGCQNESRPFRSVALSFPGAKSPQREHSLLGTFAPVELSCLGSKRSKHFSSVENSLPWNFCSSGAVSGCVLRHLERKFLEYSFSWNNSFIGIKVLGTFAPVEHSFLGSERSKNFRSCETVVPGERIFQELSLQMS